MDIDLLLADGNGEPVLAKGLPYGVAAVSARAEEPEPEQFGLLDYRQDDKDPNDLVRQRWGVIVPAGTDGKRLAEAIAPLRAARKEEQNGKEPIVFEAPAGMSAEEAGIWWGTVYNSKDIEAVDRPRYLLILGDADQISWESQQRWASSAFVGRLAFANDAGYESYVHKILACERAARAGFKKPRAAFHTVKDGTAATSTGHRGLMSPTIDAAQVGLKKNDFPASAIVDLNEEGVASLDDFMRAVALHDPTLLFSISHGLGSTAETPKDEQRRMQGAMSFGRGVKLTAEDVANKPFLPGGAWFFFACFSAGTPSYSAYQHWLASLKTRG
ncbi:MAG: hypothetical protein IPM54_35810 [Polyangiaceae bacterium]|nr:hypothetical protein [Polyangiaceae bacterium]